MAHKAVRYIGYARCVECEQLCAGYRAKGSAPDAELHVARHQSAYTQTGWSGYHWPACEGSNRTGMDSHLTANMRPPGYFDAQA